MDDRMEAEERVGMRKRGERREGVEGRVGKWKRVKVRMKTEEMGWGEGKRARIKNKKRKGARKMARMREQKRT